jgi:hypothetical protein
VSRRVLFQIACYGAALVLACLIALSGSCGRTTEPRMTRYFRVTNLCTEPFEVAGLVVPPGGTYVGYPGQHEAVWGSIYALDPKAFHVTFRWVPDTLRVSVVCDL